MNYRPYVSSFTLALAIVAAGCGKSRIVQEFPSPSGNAKAIVRYTGGNTPDPGYDVLLERSGTKTRLATVSEVLLLRWREEPEQLRLISSQRYWSTDTNVYEEVFDLNGARISKVMK
ncbi:MAG: hypothetical protein K8T26_06770 [Lentisphaerae bacterium]|nr:hypothetical protein [Lentisphaerota bacterium]